MVHSWWWKRVVITLPKKERTQFLIYFRHGLNFLSPGYNKNENYNNTCVHVCICFHISFYVQNNINIDIKSTMC